MSEAPGRPPEPTPTFKSRGGLGRLLGALRYSLAGFKAAFRHEAAFRQELLLAVVLIPIALWLPFSAQEKVLLVGSVLLVLIVELLNSAIEALVDLVSPEPNVLAGRAKDLGSAAVMLTLVLCVLTWLAIGLPVLIGVLT